MTGTILSLQVGRAQVLAREGGEWRSAIHKKPVETPLFLDLEGLTGDQQANRRFHGGPDKAVCCFCSEHYPALKQLVSGGDEFGFGAFGENFTLAGMTEPSVCVGDTYRVGTAVMQVSQPRQPCINLVYKWGHSDLPGTMTSTNQTGFYLRVLQTGEVKAGDALELQSRIYPDLTISALNDAKYRKAGGVVMARRLAELPELSGEWRQSFGKRKGIL